MNRFIEHMNDLERKRMGDEHKNESIKDTTQDVVLIPKTKDIAKGRIDNLQKRRSKWTQLELNF